MSVLGELKRRKMFQVAAVYLVVAWIIMQVIDVINEPLSLPDWFDTVVIVLLGIGFPIAMIISWAFNLTRGGVVRETGDDASPSGGRKIEYVLIGLLAIAVDWLVYRDISPPTEVAPPVAAIVEADMLPNSIAVLPFRNLSPDPDNSYYATGIYEAVSIELAKIGNFDVKSGTAMDRFAEENTTIREIAADLNVNNDIAGQRSVCSRTNSR